MQLGWNNIRMPNPSTSKRIIPAVKTERSQQDNHLKNPISRPETLVGYNISNVLETMVDSIDDKKGLGILTLDLTQIEDAVADYFLICHAESTTQVKAIADHVDEKVREVTGEKPWHREGLNNLEWVLLDYVDVVVHIFHRDKRQHYNLEDLWSDAVFTWHDDRA